MLPGTAGGHRQRDPLRAVRLSSKGMPPRSSNRYSTPTKINTANNTSHVRFTPIHAFLREPSKPGPKDSPVRTAGGDPGLGLLQNKGAFTWGRTVAWSKNIRLLIWLITKVSPDSGGGGRRPEPAGIGAKSRGGGRRAAARSLAHSLTGGGAPGRPAA